MPSPVDEQVELGVDLLLELLTDFWARQALDVCVLPATIEEVERRVPVTGSRRLDGTGRGLRSPFSRNLEE
jgi:hypothetical protein